MQGRLTHNARDLVRRMNARKGAVVSELSTAARVIGREVHSESKRIIQRKIYDVPIPLKKSAEKRIGPAAKIRSRTTKGKHGQWERSGAIKRGETYQVSGPVVILKNNAGHAIYRYVLGLEGHRKPKHTLSVQWHAEAIGNKREFVLQTRRKAVLRGLSGGAV